ncbi:SnoaL-like domain-containing protein [Rhizobium lentis]|uniref:YybH family protein n=1 Tax=Rhizobium lentis TaxID=1138194 RepID=UPI001C8364AE|nr:nuclear transport factor 2 family protein [Rhizobium lentis]MBX5043435.1 SnoaL-like domain-containing protein [Rhizobium lentis]MBX5056243.1 SnoaL-like domain-containing protein [Rhizobium lentis]MBX5074196.1 SnoaL-like domain-containing protein [Rhizobium lentis]MBX5111421.1 SnoaL-like domain-containing protein [Rhizobium lentis]MBX5117667.1 SnoaL-like domain-containing protein [Rhizobium lentis]
MKDEAKTRSEEEAIIAMLMMRARALGEKNAEEALSYEAEDSVEFSLAPPLFSNGKDEAGLQAWFDTWEGPIGGEVRDAKLTVGGDVAFWSGLMHMTGTKTDGAEVDLWFRQTLGLVKQDGRWLVAHQHASVPFAMDGSGRALLDLQP